MAELLRTLIDALEASRLPTLEPPVFSGDPITFLEWNAMFDCVVDSMDMTAAQKLVLLKKYVSDPINNSIAQFLYDNPEEAYLKSRRLIKNRFGSGYLISEAYRNRIDAWPRIRGKDYCGLRTYSDFLHECMVAQTMVTELKALDNVFILKDIAQKLPEWLQRNWQRFAYDHRQRTAKYPTFTEFVHFVRRESDIVNDPTACFKPMLKSQPIATPKVQSTATQWKMCIATELTAHVRTHAAFIVTQVSIHDVEPTVEAVTQETVKTLVKPYSEVAIQCFSAPAESATIMNDTESIGLYSTFVSIPYTHVQKPTQNTKPKVKMEPLDLEPPLRYSQQPYYNQSKLIQLPLPSDGTQIDRLLSYASTATGTYSPSHHRTIPYAPIRTEWRPGIELESRTR